MKLRVTPTQWSALQRGEEVELLERMEPQPEWREAESGKPGAAGWSWKSGERILEHWPIIGEFIAALMFFCPHAIGDKIAVVCPECEGRGWEYCDDAHDVPTRLICDCNPGDDIEYQMPQVTVHSITARQVDGVWYWVIGVKKEEENG